VPTGLLINVEVDMRIEFLPVLVRTSSTHRVIEQQIRDAWISDIRLKNFVPRRHACKQSHVHGLIVPMMVTTCLRDGTLKKKAARKRGCSGVACR